MSGSPRPHRALLLGLLLPVGLCSLAPGCPGRCDDPSLGHVTTRTLAELEVADTAHPGATLDSCPRAEDVARSALDCDVGRPIHIALVEASDGRCTYRHACASLCY